jgi:hypothetical protein
MRTYSVSNDRFVWFICDCWGRDSSWAAAALSLYYLHYNCLTHYFIDLLRNMFLMYCASWNARWRINRRLLLETLENVSRVLCFLWRCNDCCAVRISIILFAGRQHIRISCGCRAALPNVKWTNEKPRPSPILFILGRLEVPQEVGKTANFHNFICRSFSLIALWKWRNSQFFANMQLRKHS